VSIGTTVSSVALDNIFSSTYDHYKIILSMTGSTASTNLNLSLRNRVNGVSNSSSNSYVRYGWQSISTGLSNNYTAGTSLFINNLNSNSTNEDYSAVTLDIIDPFKANFTRYVYNSVGIDSLGAGIGFGWVALHDQAVSYDGLEILVSTGNVSGGTITIFGYRK
jgi:hypothetical protein